MRLMSAIAVMISASAAFADQSELVVLGNVTQDDSEYGLLSYKHALNGTLDDGIFVRFDASASQFRFVFTGTPTTGNQNVVRLAVGYAAPTGNGQVNVFGGVSHVSRDFSPAAGALTEIDETGFFLGAEYTEWGADNTGLQLLAEYESAHEAFYSRATYLFEVGEDFSVGPTVNYLDEGDYSRSAIGVWMNYDLNEDASLFASLVAAEGGNDGEAKRDSGYFELGAVLKF